ncbi:DUF1697 domain-containing protein [Caulobacter rhizosphaerae]|jgi:uncharacterized protein (DUF1697 family)|uniref:DUF1697 domain-containing protein n=1 Tax=Caulobacter rhizosphaerae TaxID=2010972 RepID=UPI0013D6E795|nr:DUF1697 domain-containing protein [Caulobacter rhizosphaerae]GGL38748.1 hypothetical protein GCM10010983_39810 [Caulobacter rhizosphaerae]
MSPHIALLRGVNVGGRKVLKDDLLGLAKDLGFDDAKTLLASGNLVLWGKAEADAHLEQRLEDGLEKRMGLRTEFFARTSAELKEIIDANPYPDEVRSHPNHLLVHFMKAPLPDGDEATLRAAITGPETFKVGTRELYIDYPEDVGHSMLDRDWKKTKRSPLGTARNWNTVLKLATMVGL